jgi:hypothetical protein
MPHDSEMVMTQRLHQRQAVTSHCALGVPGMIRASRRLRGLAITVQVRAHDRVVPG